MSAFHEESGKIFEVLDQPARNERFLSAFIFDPALLSKNHAGEKATDRSSVFQEEKRRTVPSTRRNEKISQQPWQDLGCR